ncbi:MAG: 4'-phosphopantetheinyl transferase superfamily protein [Alistipes sp.]|nr:4'-phosphopantetheinyl transferase superfamily protein [Candidatus Alistipes equi]
MKNSVFIEQIPKLEYLYSRMPSKDIEEVASLSLKRQSEILGSKMILNNALGQVQLLHDSFGGPILENNSLSVSISHSRTMLAVALSKFPCGIDIEEKDRNFIRVTPKYLSQSEIELLQSIPDGYAIAWCTKEALYKYQRTEKIDMLKHIRIIDINLDERSLHCSILDRRPIEVKYNYYSNCIAAVVFER